MIIVSLRDLQWRSRRVAIAATGTALVFCLTLLLGSVIDSLTSEADRTLDGLGMDAILFPEDSESPFYSLSLFPSGEAERVRGIVGGEVAPAILFRQALRLQGSGLTDVFLFGIDPRGPGVPPLVDGRAPEATKELVIDRASGLDLGDRMTLNGQSFEVVGRSASRTLSAGNPTAYLRLEDMHVVFLRNTQLATMLLTRGSSAEAPDGFQRYTVSEARADMLRPVDNILGSLRLLLGLLWLVAACIIGSVLYLSALERTRDFAVFKATGSRSGQLAVGLAVQAVLVSLASAAIAIVLALVMAPVFPIEVHVPTSQILLIPVVALVTGLLASTTGLRRAVAVDPAIAFGSR